MLLVKEKGLGDAGSLGQRYGLLSLLLSDDGDTVIQIHSHTVPH